MTDTMTRRPPGRPVGWSRLQAQMKPKPADTHYAPPDQSHHMPSQDFVNITVPVTETTAQHAEPSPVPVDAPAPWGTLSWPQR